jgi:SAM-dependent methyltransferase
VAAAILLGIWHLVEFEKDPGLPHNYFDIVYSIYAIGWTVDLRKTLQHAFNYLKAGGVFIFSWEHPLHNRIKYENDSYVVYKSYHEEDYIRVKHGIFRLQ